MPIEDADEKELLADDPVMEQIPVRVPPGLKKRLVALAKHRGVPLSRVIRLIITTGVADLEKRWGVHPPKN